MKKISCGVILYKKVNGVNEYVLVMESTGSYSFPKGQLNENESVLDCALRETLEETGVTPTLIPNMKRTITYKIPTGDIKEVTYFVGEYGGELNPIDKAILQAKSYPIDVCLSLLKFNQLKDLLLEVDFMLGLKKW